MESLQVSTGNPKPNEILPPARCFKQSCYDETPGLSSTLRSVHTSSFAFRPLALSICCSFDPEHDLSSRMQLLSRLGLREDSRIRSLGTNSGRLNEGMWSIDC